jgi:hypothetical protein
MFLGDLIGQSPIQIRGQKKALVASILNRKVSGQLTSRGHSTIRGHEQRQLTSKTLASR